jgi:4-oxalomesaconate hydratase
VWEAKLDAMAAMQAQRYLQTYYAQRGEQRANHARRASGNAGVRYAEAFQRVLPQVVDQL